MQPWRRGLLSQETHSFLLLSGPTSNVLSTNEKLQGSRLYIVSKLSLADAASHTHMCTLVHTHALTRTHTLTHTFPTSPPQAFPAHCASRTNMRHLLVWPRKDDSLCGRVSSKWPLVAPGSFLRAQGDPADRVIPNPRFSPPRGLGVLTA